METNSGVAKQVQGEDVSTEQPGDKNQATADEPNAEDHKTAEVLSAEEAQRLADRRVSQALETARKKWESEKEAELTKAQEEAERTKLAEEGKYRELHEKTQAELDALKSDLQNKELKAQTLEMLDELNASELAPVFSANTSTLEGRKQAASTIKGLAEQMAERIVNDRLGSKTPAKGTPPAPKGNIRAQIAEAEARGDFKTSMRLKATVKRNI